MSRALKAELAPWLVRRLPPPGQMARVSRLLDRGRLGTVCVSAQCPNLCECFGRGVATFLILGPNCTRSCRFCAVPKGPPAPPAPDEPLRVAQAAAELGLKYVVVTSVTRDDLPDGGAGQFAAVVRELKRAIAGVKVELLVPDFGGSEAALATVLEAGPDVLAHNVETVPRLQRLLRPGASWSRSVGLLARAREAAPGVVIKSGLMLGVGEQPQEVEQAMAELREAGCEILTLGQYLAPSSSHLPVARYVPPQEFERLRQIGLEMGYKFVASGPYVRSSYLADKAWKASSS